MSAFKKLNYQDVYVSDYLAKKQWNASGNTLTSYGITTHRGFSGSTPGWPYPSDIYNRSNFHNKVVYNAVNQLYFGNYSGSAESGSTIFSGSFEQFMQSDLDLSSSRQIGSEVGVISVPRDVLGLGIEPYTLVIKPDTGISEKYVEYGYSQDHILGQDQYIENVGYWYQSNPIDFEDYLVSESNYVTESVDSQYLVTSSGQQRIEIVDDGEGRLIISGGQEAYTNSERQVGEVIYNHGLVIFTDPIVARYYSTYSSHILSWKSKLPIYTYNIHCNVRESEFNFTYNPSALTGSDNTVRNNLTGSYFKPYITTIGLYNDAQELVAVGKLNRPVPKSENVDTAFVIKMDI